MSEQYTSLTEGFGKSSNQLSNVFSGFGSGGSFLKGSTDFLQSNSLVAKMAFLFLIIIMFVIILRLATGLISWWLTPKGDPKLVNGMIKANSQGFQGKIIHQDPKKEGAITILRSDNENDGLEFTYSTWLFIDQAQTDGRYKHIFHKGNENIQLEGPNNGLSMPNNAPGLYLDKDTNALVVIMNTFNNVVEKVRIDNIPYNKWFNIILRVEGAKMDVYINGTITLRHQFTSVPKQNYGDVYVCMNKGFSGFLSDLWYHNYALATRQIMDIVKAGPNLKMNDSLVTDSVPPYFSLRWYLDR